MKYSRRFVVVQPNYRRRHGICRALHRAGYPVCCIALILRIPGQRVRVILAGSTIWGAASDLLRQALSDEERRAA